MLLDGILDHNRRFVQSREARPLPAPETLHLAVIACYDPRLDTLLPRALGLEADKTFFLRAAGTIVRPDGDPLRSLALAVHMFGVTEVLVVGHTSCRMAAFETAAFIEAFRSRGVAREGFGAVDLREWVGAIPDPRRGVQSSVAAISGATFLPRDLRVAGLVLDDTTGALEVVVAPGLTLPAVPAAPAPAPPPDHPPLPLPTAEASPRAPRGAEVQPALSREIDAIRSFLSAVEQTAGLRAHLAQLRAEMGRQKSPLARLALIEKFLNRSATNARGVRTAFELLRRETASAGQAFKPDDLVELFRGRSGRTGP